MKTEEVIYKEIAENSDKAKIEYVWDYPFPYMGHGEELIGIQIKIYSDKRLYFINADLQGYVESIKVRRRDFFSWLLKEPIDILPELSSSEIYNLISYVCEAFTSKCNKNMQNHYQEIRNKICSDQ